MKGDAVLVNHVVILPEIKVVVLPVNLLKSLRREFFSCRAGFSVRLFELDDHRNGFVIISEIQVVIAVPSFAVGC